MVRAVDLETVAEERRDGKDSIMSSEADMNDKAALDNLKIDSDL